MFQALSLTSRNSEEYEKPLNCFLHSQSKEDPSDGNYTKKLTLCREVVLFTLAA